MPAQKWDEFLPSVGLDVVASYARAVLDPAWVALVLGAPGAAPAWPRLSVTFALAGDEMTSFTGPDHNYSGIRVDGDAGSQLLFSPRAAGSQITRDAVERADRLAERMEVRPPGGEIAAAISALCALTHPSLTPDQQTTLAVVALEALLLPDATTKLRATFARRVATLLAPEADRPELERVAKSSMTRAARACIAAAVGRLPPRRRNDCSRPRSRRCSSTRRTSPPSASGLTRATERTGHSRRRRVPMAWRRATACEPGARRPRRAFPSVSARTRWPGPRARS